jgi:hypothetical protein
MKYPFEFVASLPLAHSGDCSLIGVAPDLTIYAEEIYGEEGWLAQHALKLDEKTIAFSDENSGMNRDFEMLTLPNDLARSQPCKHTSALNFSGPRQRGLREPERIAELVRPLTIQTKMTLIERLKLNIMPPMLLGIAESYVLAEAPLFPPDVFMVCRRLRLAYALSQAKYDADHQLYDYDTLVLYIAHDYNPRVDDEIPPERALAGLPGVHLRRPMDCIVRDQHLFIADGGTTEQVSAVHIWRIAKTENL